MAQLDTGFQLAVIKGEDRGRIFPLRYEEIHLGRKTSTAQNPYWVYFAEPTVSRHHATLQWDGARRLYSIHHRSQTNPTLVNGKRVVSAFVGPEDVIQIGLLVFRVEKAEVTSPAASLPDMMGVPRNAPAEREVPPASMGPPPRPPVPSPAQPPRKIADKPPESTRDAGPEAEPEAVGETGPELQTGLRLTVTEGPDRGRIFPLTGTVLYIGRREGMGDRRPTNAILLNDDDLPREQVLLAWNEREQSYGIFHVESSNVPTRVIRLDRGEALTTLLNADTQMLLQLDDVVRFGRSALRLELDAALEAARQGTSAAPAARAPEENVRATREIPGIFGSRKPPREEATPQKQPEGWQPGGDESSRRQIKRAPSLGEEDIPLAPAARRRRETPTEPVDAASSEKPALPRPVSLFSSDEDTEAPRPTSEAREAAPLSDRPTVSKLGNPGPQSKPVIKDAPPPRPASPETGVERLDTLYLPTLDVNLVRTLPTRATPDAPPPRMTPRGSSVPAPSVTPPRVPPERAQAAPPPAAPAPPRATGQAAPPSAPPPRGNVPPSRPTAAPLVADSRSAVIQSKESASSAYEDAETLSRAPTRRRAGAENEPKTPTGADLSDTLGGDDDEGFNFKDAGFVWRWRADYILGFLEGPNKGQKIELLTDQLEDGRRITMGSDGERLNEIVIDDPAVPNVQATITYAVGRFTLLNEGSESEIAVNDMAVSPRQEMLLKTGDRVTMGTSVMIFLERSVVQSLSRFQLAVLNGIPEDRGRSFDLLREAVVIGRHRTCEISLADPEISRKHLSITLRNGRFYLSHLSTSNPTFINGISLPRGRDRLLNDGDKIQVSDHTTLLFRERPSRK